MGEAVELGNYLPLSFKTPRKVMLDAMLLAVRR